MNLDHLLARIAVEDADLAPPDWVESRVMRELEGPRKAVCAGFAGWIPVWTAAAAACLVAGAIAFREAPRVPDAVADQPFLPVPYTAPPAPYERTRIVRMEMPVAALIAAGFEVHAPDAGAALQADVLIGQDGRALAVRILSDSERRISQ
jgi:hypothetical protein